jgi:acyl dehydratase
MPLNAAQVGQSGAVVTTLAEARWMMAFAAAIGDMSPAYVDTTREITAHPLFPVCLEWPCLLDRTGFESGNGLTEAEAARGVHATHDLQIIRPIRSGDCLTTRKTVMAVEARRAGAFQLLRFDTVDARGDVVAITHMGLLSRDVALEGSARSVGGAPALPTLPAEVAPRLSTLTVPTNAAHVYTEGARIWNPIHTDRRIALGAGLPDSVFHGTGLLAMAVSQLGARRQVRRVACRFTGLVRMPSTLALTARAAGAALWFDVSDDAGRRCVSDGYLEFDAREEALR